MLGLETALSIVNQTMVATGLMSWEAVADRMSIAPARIGRYEDHGQEIAVGNNANLSIIDPSQSYRVDRDLVASRSRNTPFHGIELQGVVTATFFRGHPTFSNGELSPLGGN
jgi:dihydroorotase